MTADTQAQGDLVRMIEKHCDFIRVDSVTQEVRHYLFTPAQIEILAAALQGRGTQEGDWKTAVLDELAVTCMDAPVGTPPREILKRIFEWHVQADRDLNPDRAQEGEPSDAALKEAFQEGFNSVSTYNDVRVNDSDAAWLESHTRAALAQAQKERVQGDAARAWGEG